VFVFGIFDKDLEGKSISEQPQVYQRGPNKALFTRNLFAGWVLYGVVQSMTISLMTLHLLLPGDMVDGKLIGIWSAGNIIFSNIIITVNVTLGLQMHYWTYLSFLTVIGSIAVWFLFILLYNLAPLDTLVNFPLFKGVETIYHSFSILLPSAEFWLSLIIVTTTCLCPTIVYKYYMEVINPAPELIMREAEVCGTAQPPKEDDAEMAMPHIAPGPNKKPLERKRTVVWERDDTKGGGVMVAKDFTSSMVTPAPDISMRAQGQSMRAQRGQC